MECLYDTSLKGKPVVVAGDEETRHGIVLAKSYEAKRFGIRTGEALWEARRKCPEAVFVPAHYDRYLKYSSLARYGIRTIGDLARYDPDLLRHSFGKVGVMLWAFANGQDSSGVSPYYAVPPVKTIGNSTTAPRDLKTEDDVKITLYALGESVAARLRAQRSVCSTVQLGIRGTALIWYERQTKLLRPTNSSSDLVRAAMGLYRQNRPDRPIRSLSLRASGLGLEDEASQLSLFPEDNRSQRRMELERTVDSIRGKYGYASIWRGIMLKSPELDLDAQRDHVIHPIGFLKAP